MRLAVPGVEIPTAKKCLRGIAQALFSKEVFFGQTNDHLRRSFPRERTPEEIAVIPPTIAP